MGVVVKAACQGSQEAVHLQVQEGAQPRHQKVWQPKADVCDFPTLFTLDSRALTQFESKISGVKTTDTQDTLPVR